MAPIRHQYSMALRLRIVEEAKSVGYSPDAIHKRLSERGYKTTISGISRFLKHYRETGSVARKPGSGRPTKFTPEALGIVQEQMEKSDETTALDIQRALEQKFYKVSLRTALNGRIRLGWRYANARYCQVNFYFLTYFCANSQIFKNVIRSLTSLEG